MSAYACAISKKTSTVPSQTPVTSSLLQRKCACGGSSQGSCGCKKQPLDSQAQQFMEPRFGHDFSKVRIHADDSSAHVVRHPTKTSSVQRTQLQRSCAPCSSAANEEREKNKKPEHKGFTYDDLMAGEVKEEEEKPEELVAKAGDRWPTKEDVPHFVSATIKCEKGDYVVKLNDWAGKPCGISDCVTVHESSHIDDWRARWPKGCKKEDGTNQPDGYLPTGGDGYDEFLKKSECTAHTKDLDCAENKLKTAEGDCKTKLTDYVKLTKDQKAGYC